LIVGKDTEFKDMDFYDFPFLQAIMSLKLKLGDQGVLLILKFIPSS
jgi:hypothetical protein